MLLCVYSAHVIMCLCVCVCAFVCVALQSPLFHKVYFYFKSDSTALWHLTTRLNSSPGVTKLEPVGPALLIDCYKVKTLNQ